MLFCFCPEVKISSISLTAANLFDTCRAYLHLNETVEPALQNVRRSVSSSDLTFASATSSNDIFEITTGSLSTSGDLTNVSINVQYIMSTNNYSTVVWGNASFGNTTILDIFVCSLTSTERDLYQSVIYSDNKIILVKLEMLDYFQSQVVSPEKHRSSLPSETRLSFEV